MSSLALCLYGLAALGALAVFLAMPREGRAQRAPAVLIGLAALAGLIVMLIARYGGPAGANTAFVILAMLSIIGAVRVITHPRPVYSVLYFVLVALSSATLVLLVGAQFLWVAIVAVYAGAILVTYVFVIMLAQSPGAAEQDAYAELGAGPLDYDRHAREPLAAVLAGFLLMAVVCAMLVDRGWPPTGRTPLDTNAVGTDAAVADTAGHTVAVGRLLMTDHAVSLEVAGVLLLVAMVGAIVLARRRIEPDAQAMPPEETPPDVIGRTVKPF